MCVCACVHVYICVYVYICIYNIYAYMNLSCFAILNLPKFIYTYVYNLLDDYLNAVQPPKVCLLH